MRNERMVLYTGEDSYELPRPNGIVRCLTFAVPLSTAIWAVLIFALWDVAPTFARLLLVGLAAAVGIVVFLLWWFDGAMGSTTCGGRR